MNPQLGLHGGTVTNSATYYQNGKGAQFGVSSDVRQFSTIPAINALSNTNIAWPMSIARVGCITNDQNAAQGVSFGVVPNTSNSPPFHGITFNISGGGTNIPHLAYGSGTTLYTLNYDASQSTARQRILGDHVHVGVVQSGSQLLYVDGVQVASATTTLSKPSMSNPVMTMSYYPPGPDRYLLSSETMLAIWNRALSANEVAEYSADPFCFLRY